MYRSSPTLATILATAAFVLAANAAQAASFVTEATRVFDRVIDQGRAATTEIDAFHQDFSESAARMVDLEARVERWKAEGYLCERYVDCAEEYDLIYAFYGQSMAEIEEVFQRHQDSILAALSWLNHVVYEGKDQLSDLRSDDLAALPAELERLRGVQARLKTQNAALEHECPERTSRKCARKWRAFHRDLDRSHREIKRVAYTRELATVREALLKRLDSELGRYSDFEEDVVATLADYASTFEEYGELSGTEGIGKLLLATTDLHTFAAKVRQLRDFGKGPQIPVPDIGELVPDIGELVSDRLNLITGQDLDVESRREALTDSGRLLEGNDRLLRELEREVGLDRTASR